MSADKLVKTFSDIAKKDVAYTDEPKKKFHRAAKALLKQIAEDLGYSPTQYDLRSEMGGIAGSGEITLHTDNLYIQISQYLNGDIVLFRSCESRKDFSGGHNNHVGLLGLYQYENTLERFRKAMGGRNGTSRHS